MNQTTKKGWICHTIDVVITKYSDNIIDNLVMTGPALCDKSGNISGDHYAISFSTHVETTSKSKDRDISKATCDQC